MAVDLTLLIGGAAGQGIQTVGDLLVGVCRRAGLYVFAINDYESRIRGGHSFFQLRISDRQLFAPVRSLHLLLAMDKETVRRHRNNLSEDGLIVQDRPDAEKPVSVDDGVQTVPITGLAEEAGGKIMANTVAAGVCLALIGAPWALFADTLEEHFAGAGKEVRQNNLAAAERGFQTLPGISFSWAFPWPQDGSPRGAVMNGARALALGSLAADCRLGAFYPMSPATGIMQVLSDLSVDGSLVVEQAEDEIAAVNMTIGASFAGVRALTATSGGGFCLMTEGLGLAGITETPLVIINSQRPGPATGLPTRTAQGDLLFVINAAQDEFPRFVLAPRTAAEGYEIMGRAFDLSDKYQVPVIVLTDHFFNDALCIVEESLAVPARLDRYIAADDDLPDPAAYRRYALTESGISPRALPCRGKALVMASGNEHLEDGHISEDRDNRTALTDKRLAKLAAMVAEMRPPEEKHSEAGTLLVGWGSTAGALNEAVDRLRKQDHDVGAVNFCDLWPFPGEAAAAVMSKAKRIITVEANATAQLGRLLRQETGLTPAGAILQYDGRPFTPEDIMDRYQAVEGENHG